MPAAGSKYHDSLILTLHIPARRTSTSWMILEAVALSEFSITKAFPLVRMAYMRTENIRFLSLMVAYTGKASEMSAQL